MFDEKSLNTLEYGKILSLAAAYTQSEGGRRDMLALVPCSTLAAASRELSLTAEADRVLFEFSVSPSFAIDDIDEVLQKSEKGAVLSIGELLRAGRVLRVADRLSAAQPCAFCSERQTRAAGWLKRFPRGSKIRLLFCMAAARTIACRITRGYSSAIAIIPSGEYSRFSLLDMAFHTPLLNTAVWICQLAAFHGTEN